LEAANGYRGAWDTEKLALDVDKIKEIAKLLTKMKPDGTTPDVADGEITTLLETKGKDDSKTHCHQAYFEAADAKLPNVDKATETLYTKGVAAYDPATFFLKAGGNEDDLKNFYKLMWKKTSKVAFGYRGKYVVAWFCSVKADLTGTLATKSVEKEVGVPC
jgi:hypothetical protein